jgi:hypothetical protein
VLGDVGVAAFRRPVEQAPTYELREEGMSSGHFEERGDRSIGNLQYSFDRRPHEIRVVIPIRLAGEIVNRQGLELVQARTLRVDDRVHALSAYEYDVDSVGLREIAQGGKESVGDCPAIEEFNGYLVEFVDDDCEAPVGCNLSQASKYRASGRSDSEHSGSGTSAKLK